MKRDDIQELGAMLYRLQPEIGAIKCMVIAIEVYQWLKNKAKLQPPDDLSASP